MLPTLGEVRPEERRGATAAFVTLLGILAGHTLLETARDALFLARIPPTRLPFMYIAIAAVDRIDDLETLRVVADKARNGGAARRAAARLEALGPKPEPVPVPPMEVPEELPAEEPAPAAEAVAPSAPEATPEPEAAAEPETAKEPEAEQKSSNNIEKFLDLVIVRPLYFSRLVVGLPFFVFYPFTLASGYQNDVVALLWTDPYEATFKRPLGESPEESY